MTDQELLQAMRQMMQEELKPINQRLDTMEEGLEEVRAGVNILLDWAERASHVLEFPLPKVIE
ncbi:hypothetical protein [Intestinimonas butyriciproducens]|uniref:hypothetical protein n=1 Tax=Intestinimonas butyriciproducens TaxID=1297617 RepID=UPI0018AA143D|nr:hypothetical protein [Intestinimonas butyriciproducens]MDB7817286.1 hypothetical protein [Intestinimonas butyriciproducens]MDB7843830.1 hypothetical protein [Intestinimonas butyriciproducens]MDB7858311.1 hypothetical protein [Intestinimonas butyriciproducens]